MNEQEYKDMIESAFSELETLIDNIENISPYRLDSYKDKIFQQIKVEKEWLLSKYDEIIEEEGVLGVSE